MTHKIHTAFGGRMIMIGCGSIGQGVLPLLLRHIEMRPEQLTIITGDPRGETVAKEYGVGFKISPLTRDNYKDVIGPLNPRDMIVNLSVDVSSIDLMRYCASQGALYLDTCIEPWAGGYTDTSLSASARSNYGLREEALKIRADFPNGPTLLPTHGANPGMVSHLVKQAMLNLARDIGKDYEAPADKAGWAALAQELGIKVIHVAERDTQYSATPWRMGEFVNTWSIDGFIGEGLQPAELGWGTHEKALPFDGARHDFGSGAAIYLKRPGCTTMVRSWTPIAGPQHAFLITHSEAISIADYLTVRDGDAVAYRPTVHYAYHPCQDAVLSIHAMSGNLFHPPVNHRLLGDDIVGGIDELGVLLMGHEKNAYWYGSRLAIEEARRLAPHNSATSLQVTSAVMAGVVYCIQNPDLGLIEPDDMDFVSVIKLMHPYLGPLLGSYTGWTPLEGRGVLFDEDVDRDDPWQFKNIRVI